MSDRKRKPVKHQFEIRDDYKNQIDDFINSYVPDGEENNRRDLSVQRERNRYSSGERQTLDSKSRQSNPPKQPTKTKRESNKQADTNKKAKRPERPTNQERPVDQKRPTNQERPINQKRPTNQERPVNQQRPTNQARPKKSVKLEKSAKPLRRPKPREKRPISPQKLKFRRFILSFLAISVVVIVGVFLSLTVWFKTAQIRIEGDILYSNEQILNVCPIKTGDNIFLANKKNAENVIVDQLPYVESADVKFSIPDTIIISVVQAQAAYQVSTSEGYYYVSAAGRIIDKQSQKLENVPIIKCVGLVRSEIGEKIAFDEIEDETTEPVTDENGETVATEPPELKITTDYVLTELTTELANLQISNITVIDVQNLSKIRIVYDDRIIIVLGNVEELNYKLRVAFKIINDNLDPNGTGMIKGRLDVSMCIDTKRSYFNEKETYAPDDSMQALDGQTPSETSPSDTTTTATVIDESGTASPTSETGADTALPVVDDDQSTTDPSENS